MSWNPVQVTLFLLNQISNKTQLIHFTIFTSGICFRHCRRAICFCWYFISFSELFFREKVYLHIPSELIDTESTYTHAIFFYRKQEHILLYRPYHIVLWPNHVRRTWSSRVQVMVCRLSATAVILACFPPDHVMWYVFQTIGQNITMTS